MTAAKIRTRQSQTLVVRSEREPFQLNPINRKYSVQEGIGAFDFRLTSPLCFGAVAGDGAPRGFFSEVSSSLYPVSVSSCRGPTTSADVASILVTFVERLKIIVLVSLS